ncbi:chaperonin containing TCP1, group II (cytosolic) [Monocercomonoides exilis]|uniref:chaperonin containing TCP1, group II (cytosolic) n=1 Tax=Monocercomonoides exilis TaxID=2049356 RepID=UPI00355AA7A9|nr:chaperonin containing TCP1, group II (cytosolic) [Monocercomonoides exilis]|eukprot:MONOS_1991.1-p1 / transcript=MONOS_1991.1 / gene=MONOS_1991 / organism=Monocercomonoides_exilis_PA203 / gene_product=chaperonin containing TCP1, group II (cytosolic) / transcript_product=chaperonin containing TCP1, group II (cytosolic) / location=Mono_scaffold00038:99747-101726(+) / protein_length=540 / sequence_SO=supercontig / SO=protein_coding / is_pseudo=false
MSVNPILRQGASEDKAENARMSNFVGAIAVKDLVKSTLGPKGMDKIMQSTTNPKEITITNDGATILKSLASDNAAAKILINVSMTQDSEVGDGTTSVVVLTGELLAEAEKLVNKKIHPQTIIMGFRKAQEVAQKALLKCAIDNSEDKEKYMNDLLNLARTTLSSKILTQDREQFSRMAVEAILRQGDDVSLESIGFIKKIGGTLADSYLDDGILLPKSIGVGQPHRVEHPKIMIANTGMDADKIKIYGAKVKTSKMEDLIELEAAEKEKMKKKVDRICSSGCTVFINRLLIYDYPQQLFTSKGVVSIQHAEFDGIERLAKVTGAEIVGEFSEGTQYKLGTCDLIEEVIIGEDRVIRFSGLPFKGASTIVLRGANQHVLDEAERSLHDALCVLQQTARDHRVVYGGGSVEMVMAQAVEEEANRTGGKKQLAMLAFASALRQIPTILADNAGYDAHEIVSQLRAAHYEHSLKRKEAGDSASGECDLGLDLDSGKVGSMKKLGVVESIRVKNAVLNSASEACELILRVDTILTAAPRERQEQ